jgi:hypothetical protein
LAYQKLAASAQGLGRLRLFHARHLVRAGEPLTALKWLDLAPEEFGLEKQEAQDLRVMAARKLDDNAKVVTYLYEAFLETFEVGYFRTLIEHAPAAARAATRVQVLGATRSAANWNADRAFRFLIDEREWALVEEIYLRFKKRPIFLFGISGRVGVDDLNELVTPLSEILPEVACALLRFAAEHWLQSGKRSREAVRALECSERVCPEPIQHPSHAEFRADLGSKFSRNRRLRTWLKAHH